MLGTRRARVLVSLVLLVALLTIAATPAVAHPLGNFTINHYTRVEVGRDQIRLRYVLDLAEIPSVQEARAADSDGDGSVSPAEWEAYKKRRVDELAGQLELTVDGTRVELRPTDATISQPSGQGDIPLVRLEAWLVAPTVGLGADATHRAIFRDRGDSARPGWREIVVQPSAGVSLVEANAPAEDVTDELRRYPDDLLQNPLDQREAHWTFNIDPTQSATAPPTRAEAPQTRPTDPFAALVTASELNPTVVLLAVLGAAVLGGIHAASPGHGKSVMAAYIVGTRGTIGHALVLALSVTLAHTTGVLALGVATVLASNLIFPERLYPWLTLVSGALVMIVGLRFLLLASRRGLASQSHAHALDHDHEHVHDHSHGHSHVHAPGALAPTWRSLFALGLAGGVVPSGSALVVLLSSVALGRLGFGLVLIVAFGLGMAVVLVTIGVLLVHAGRLMGRLFPDASPSPLRRRLLAAIPLASAGIMTLLGVVAAFEGLSQIGAPWT